MKIWTCKLIFLSREITRKFNYKNVRLLANKGCSASVDYRISMKTNFPHYSKSFSLLICSSFSWFRRNFLNFHVFSSISTIFPQFSRFFLNFHDFFSVFLCFFRFFFHFSSFHFITSISEGENMQMSFVASRKWVCLSVFYLSTLKCARFCRKPKEKIFLLYPSTQNLTKW